MTKRTISVFFYCVAALICAASFFIHETTKPQTTEYLNALEAYSLSKKPRKKALDEVKKLAVGTPEYDSYLIARSNTAEYFKKLKDQEVKDQFLGFSNINQFLGEFGWALGLSIYSLIMLVLSNIRFKRSPGETILHGTLLSVGVFYILYTLQPFSDFNKLTYILFSIITAVAVAVSMRIIKLERRRYIALLLSNIKSLVSFVLNNTKEEKKNEMWNVLEKVAEDE